VINDVEYEGRRHKRSPNLEHTDFFSSTNKSLHYKPHLTNPNNPPTKTNMSDLGRKDFSTKAKESMTPDSSKSTTTKISEGLTDTGDKIA
jgi:hypothetical protein